MNGVSYLQAIHDYKDSRGLWRQKVLASFGRADKPENVAQARLFVAAADGFVRTAEQWGRDFDSLEPLEKAFLAILGGAAIAWLVKSIGR